MADSTHFRTDAHNIWASAWDFQQYGMCDQQSLRSACAYAQSDQSLCQSLEYSMIVKLLTEYHLEWLSLKGGCRGSSESTHFRCHIVGNLMHWLICKLLIVYLFKLILAYLYFHNIYKSLIKLFINYTMYFFTFYIHVYLTVFQHFQ